MDDFNDSIEVREGEELDKIRVREFLVDSIPGLSGDITIRQFPGGFSNLTYLVTVGDREMVLRRPPAGKKAKTAHDMSREYRVLKALKPHFKYCPEPLVYTEDESVTGSPFYVMERLKGIILRKNFPDGFSLNPEQAEGLCDNLINVLCELHKIDYKKIGLEDFGKPEGYVKRQIEGWSRRYRDAITPDAPDYENVMKWLTEKMPPDSGYASIIHNDFKFDNVVLNPDNPLDIIGVLDWEMATLGDPLMELGSSLAYWVQKDDSDDLKMIRLMPTTAEGMLTREEIVRRYGDIMGMDIKNFDYYYCFGLFRLAVIAQQIYYRYYHGQTKDERFRTLIFAVKILDDTAGKIIERSQL